MFIVAVKPSYFVQSQPIVPAAAVACVGSSTRAKTMMKSKNNQKKGEKNQKKAHTFRIKRSCSSRDAKPIPILIAPPGNFQTPAHPLKWRTPRPRVWRWPSFMMIFCERRYFVDSCLVAAHLLTAPTRPPSHGLFAVTQAEKREHEVKTGPLSLLANCVRDKNMVIVSLRNNRKLLGRIKVWLPWWLAVVSASVDGRVGRWNGCACTTGKFCFFFLVFCVGVACQPGYPFRAALLQEAGGPRMGSLAVWL